MGEIKMNDTTEEYKIRKMLNNKNIKSIERYVLIKYLESLQLTKLNGGKTNGN